MSLVGRRRCWKEEGETQMETSTPFYTQLRPSVILAKVKRKEERSDASIGVIYSGFGYDTSSDKMPGNAYTIKQYFYTQTIIR